MEDNIQHQPNRVTLPNNKIVNLQLYVLDPLSVIIKLAILSNKPIGTKIYVYNNVVYLHEPGVLQSIKRYALNTNKTDIQYLYNPVIIACREYLNKTTNSQYPKLKDLFRKAQIGLDKLKRTYINSSIIELCLNYYTTIIDFYMTLLDTNSLQISNISTTNNSTYSDLSFQFRSDYMTIYYTPEVIKNFQSIWSPETIKIVLNLINYLSCHDDKSHLDVRSLENIMETIDGGNP